MPHNANTLTSPPSTPPAPSTLPEGIALRKERVGCLPSSVMHLLLSGWLELVDQGFAEHAGLLLHSGQHVLWLERGGAPVAAVAYDVWEERRAAAVSLGCVAKDCRRQGLYRMLTEQLRRTCRAAGLRTLQGGIHTRNTTMRQVAESLGRAESYVRYVETL